MREQIEQIFKGSTVVNSKDEYSCAVYYKYMAWYISHEQDGYSAHNVRQDKRITAKTLVALKTKMDLL